MDVRRRGEIWDEIWAEYDERQVRRSPLAGRGRRSREEPRGSVPGTRGPVRAAPPGPAAVAHPRPAAPARPVRPVATVALGLLTGMVLLAAWMAAPWLLAARLAVPLGRGDAPGLLREFDAPSAMASLRAGLAAEAERVEGEGARRFLDGLAARMAESWARPEAVSAWLAMRGRGGRFEGSPVPVSAPRSARPTGLGSFRLEYGPAGEASGIAFEMAWQGDGFRVTGVRFLDAPSAPVAYVAVPAGVGPDRRQMAMR